MQYGVMRLSERVIAWLFVGSMSLGIVYAIVEIINPGLIPNPWVAKVFAVGFVGILAAINLRTLASGISLYRGERGPVTRQEFPVVYWIYTTYDLLVLVFVSALVIRAWISNR